MKLFDANVILRYILNDNETMAQKVENLLESSQVFVPIEVIAEVVYVLLKVYKVERREISNTIDDFISIPSVQTTSDKVIKVATVHFASDNLDFVDCLLIGYKQIEMYDIITFDKKLVNFLNK